MGDLVNLRRFRIKKGIIDEKSYKYTVIISSNDLFLKHEFFNGIAPWHLIFIAVILFYNLMPLFEFNIYVYESQQKNSYSKFTIIFPGGQNKMTTHMPIFRKTLPMNIYINHFLYLYMESEF